MELNHTAQYNEAIIITMYIWVLYISTNILTMRI